MGERRGVDDKSDICNIVLVPTRDSSLYLFSVWDYSAFHYSYEILLQIYI